MATSFSFESERRRTLALVIAMTMGTPLETRRYEQHLLNRFLLGDLTIDDVIALLDASVYHVFYRSQTTYFPNEAQLQDLLDWSRSYNAQHDITGLLLYSDGRFAQFIEWPEKEVCTLFERIQQDSRHQHVTIISEGPGPNCWFADWQMAFGQLEPIELHQVLRTIEVGSLPILPLDNPHVQTLVEASNLI